MRFKIEKPFRKLIVVWSTSLITWVVLQTFDKPYEITASTVSALTVVVGLLGTAIVFYKYNRHKEECDPKNEGKKS